MTEPLSLKDQEAVRAAVREGYGEIARGERSGCCGPSACCGTEVEQGPDRLARTVGYAEEDLASLPEGANLGLSCGNSPALASLRPGETVADLGCGGGFDVFIAARKVGPEGRVIGVDMTPEMLAKARRNAIAFEERTGMKNVEFRLGEIEHLPLADRSVDAVLSNCVINLSPDKPQVWREIARVLRPGGRVAVSDLALLIPLPKPVAGKIEALVGCVAGAALVEDTERWMREAGLTDIELEKKSSYVDALSSWRDPLYLKIKEDLPPGENLGDFLTSLSIRARKPVAEGARP